MGNIKSVVSDIESILNNSLCEDAGIIQLSIEEGLIEIGAMNPEYIRVKEVISELKRRFNIDVVLKQITSSEWEEWMENNPLNSIPGMSITSIENIETDNNMNPSVV